MKALTAHYVTDQFGDSFFLKLLAGRLKFNRIQPSCSGFQNVSAQTQKHTWCNVLFSFVKKKSNQNLSRLNLEKFPYLFLASYLRKCWPWVLTAYNLAPLLLDFWGLAFSKKSVDLICLLWKFTACCSNTNNTGINFTSDKNCAVN